MSKKIRFPFQPSDHGRGPHYSQAPKQEIVFRGLIMAAAVVIILAGIKAASGIIAPMLLALFATIILLVPLRWLQSKGCPSVLSLIIVLGCVAIIFLGLSRLIVSSLTDLSKETRVNAKRIELAFDQFEKTLEDYGYKIDFGFSRKETQQKEEARPENDADSALPAPASEPETTPSDGDLPVSVPPPVTESQADVQDALAPPETTSDEPPVTDSGEDHGEPKTFLERVGILPHHDPDEDHEKTFTEEELPTLPQTPVDEGPLLTNLNAQSLTNWFTKIFNEIRHLLEKSFLVMIITLFMIFETSRFPDKIDRAFGKGPITNEHLHKIATEIRRYLFLKAISSAMSGAAATCVYVMFGVPSAMFWGVIAFFLYFIPNIGGIVASIIPGLLIFMDHGLGGVLLYAVCLVAIECMIGYGIEPKILGHGLGISTVVIILSLITWGWLLGAIGLFLAAPLTIMVKIILQAFKETEWIAILIGDGSKRAG